MRMLKILRESHGLTQSDVAKKIEKSNQAYSLYELGKREPDNATLVKLATFYGVTTDYLLEKEDSTGKPSISTKENQVLAIYDKLSEDAKRKLEAYCEDLLGNPKNLRK